MKSMMRCLPCLWLLGPGLAWAQTEVAPSQEVDELSALLDLASEPASPAPDQTAEPAEPATPPSSASGDELAVIPVVPLPQEAEPLPAQESELPSRRTQGVLEEIVVTATKREANLRDLPLSISALRGEDLERSGAQGQEDFLKVVPGVTFTNDSVTASRITIRGIGADLNTSNTTGIFLGDVPFDDPTLPRVTLDPNPFDLARIEVLKGPQGTLFGGSALNGAVRYVPQEPVLAEWGLKTFAQTESVHEGDLGITYGAAVNVPFGERFALRLVGFDRSSPGWVDDNTRRMNDVNKVDQRGGRVMARWQPGENWKITAMGVFQETHSADSPITDNRDGQLSRSNTPQASPIDSRYDLETIGIQYSFSNFDVLSQSSRTYKKFKAIADASRIGNTGDNPPPSLTIVNDNASQGLMQELRFTSNDGSDSSWSWLGGAFYRQVHLVEVSDILASNQSLPIPPAVLDALAGFIPGFGGFITEDGKINTARGRADPIDVTEMALFGESTWTFWEALDLTLGLRAYQTVSDSAVYFSGALATTPSSLGQTERVSAGRLKDTGINPKIAVKYTFSDRFSVYASASRGFRFGGAQVLVGTLTSSSPPFYKSDTLDAFEIGLRTAWLDQTLTVDITPFYADWINPQLQQADATGLGSFFDNVGGARSRGVELAVRWLTPLPGLALSFAGSWVDTVTSKPFTTSDGTDTQPGTRWPLAAKWQSATTLAYQRPLFGNWEGGGNLLYTTISSAPNTLSYLDTVFGYRTLDATLSVANRAIKGRPELALTLSNATDERGIVSGVSNPQFANNYTYIRPRTLIARLAFSF